MTHRCRDYKGFRGSSESQLMFGVSMRVLVVFALGVLGFSLAEGRVVTKCELRQRLFQVIATLPQSAQQSGLKADDIVAKSKFILTNLT